MGGPIGFVAIAEGLTALREWRGFSVRETGGTNPAVVEIRDGANNGPVIALIRLAANDTRDPVVFPVGIATAGKVFIHITGTGTVDGAIYGV